VRIRSQEVRPWPTAADGAGSGSGRVAVQSTRGIRAHRQSSSASRGAVNVAWSHGLRHPVSASALATNEDGLCLDRVVFGARGAMSPKGTECARRIRRAIAIWIERSELGLC
jgi:hypothetical protein